MTRRRVAMAAMVIAGPWAARGVAMPLGATAPAQPEAVVHRLEDLPPGVRLGARAEGLRRLVPVVPVVVIVEDAASLIAAVESWRLERRFPVLLDDGSARAQEDIARFVRAFAPEQVVTWRAPEAGAVGGRTRRDAIESAVAACWGLQAEAPAPVELLARFREIEFVPPGVIVADPSDPAWPAALILGAGRGQPIAWLSAGGRVNGAMEASEASGLCASIERFCQDTGLSWAALGDDLDAVTICLNCPVKVRVDPDTLWALTDRVGRHGDDTTGSRRWGWAGQIFGTEAQATYRAMCALFLQASSVWMFDSYPDSTPWSAFDPAPAVEFLDERSFTTIVDDAPSQGRDNWLLRAQRPVEAELILVNTQGNRDFFELRAGRCGPGDVPILSHPSMVVFTHSWSATQPADLETVAGRWFDHGCCAYFGSVQEPYLQAFVPTPTVVARLLAMMPFGVAPRLDRSPPWKLAVLADPLITLGPPATRLAPDALPLTGATDLEPLMRESVGQKQFDEALELLVLLGRDEQAARLAEAILRDDPSAFSARVAQSAVPAIFRSGRATSVIDAYGLLSPEDRADPLFLDILWHAARPQLSGPRAEEVVTLLAGAVRPEQLGQDLSELAPAWARVFGHESVLAMLNSRLAEAKNQRQRRDIEQVIGDMGGARVRPNRPRQ